THVTVTPVNPDGQQQSSSVSSQFVTSMLNPSPDAGIDSLFESTPRVDVQASTIVAPLILTAPTLPPPTIPTISQVPQAPTPPTTAPSTFWQHLPSFGSLFGFDDHLKTLEANFFEFVQTNQFARAFSFILGIVERYMDQQMNEAVKIIKEQFKKQVKVQVSKILPKIEKTVNEQLEAEVLTRSSNSSKTSYAVAADLSEMELKKILIEKMESNNYDKYALWGISHWGHKRQQFYGFAVNRESVRDVYSKRRIIAVTKLQTVEWHNYKHLDWIMVRRDDDKLYKFKEGNFNRLHIQDIEDMLLLLIQGKLTNLKDRFAFNVSLRIFTRSIVIQRRMKDLQLGVESYQKKLNLTKLNSYCSDLKRKEDYISYSNPRGFIYQNKDKQNRLMRIDELHKFSDGKLNDVRTALDDHLKGIRMKYLPQAIWRRSDKERAAAMIQAIYKQLKTRRIMRSLEKFVGGRLYEGDFRMLQQTI
nr:hypothetical protein [Tanacetum cinerariifolium]